PKPGDSRSPDAPPRRPEEIQMSRAGPGFQPRIPKAPPDLYTYTMCSSAGLAVASGAADPVE
ncbi:MAG: hypothetical protein ACLPY5_13680, partial [Candidatus Bathyarchaeia archaeon]